MTDTNGAERPLSESLALFDRYRDYIRHEDTNIHNRMTWFIQLNAFLVLSLGAVTAAEINGLANCAGDQFRLMQIFVIASTFQSLSAITGVATASMAFIAVQAANGAVSKLRQKGNQVLKSALAAELPASLTGGGTRWNELAGGLLVPAIPIGVGLLWLIPGSAAIGALLIGLDEIGMIDVPASILHALKPLRTILPVAL